LIVIKNVITLSKNFEFAELNAYKHG